MLQVFRVDRVRGKITLRCDCGCHKYGDEKCEGCRIHDCSINSEQLNKARNSHPCDKCGLSHGLYHVNNTIMTRAEVCLVK